MIPVTPRPEPPHFDAAVRQKGVAWLAANALPVKGPLPAKQKIKNWWVDCLADLHSAYSGICAYACVEIDRVAGFASVEHFVAKSVDVSLAYEWSNYRLVCGRMNARKSDHADVLDPFKIVPGTFELNLLSGAISASVKLDATTHTAALQTIRRLSLDDSLLRTRRLNDFDLFFVKRTYPFDYLRQVSPFVAWEVERQGYR